MKTVYNSKILTPGGMYLYRMARIYNGELLTVYRLFPADHYSVQGWRDTISVSLKQARRELQALKI